MTRKKVSSFEFIDETNRLMRDGGLFLVSKGIDGKTNAMTIGWGLIGTIWREPVFMVAVRLSRFTYKLLEESKSFTICLPSKKMAHSLEVCGIKSGRDVDKFQELELTPVRSHTIEAPFIEECPVHYECKIVYKNELKPGKLHNVLEKDVYPNSNYHVLYFGRILGVYAVESASKMLPK